MTTPAAAVLAAIERMEAVAEKSTALPWERDNDSSDTSFAQWLEVGPFQRHFVESTRQQAECDVEFAGLSRAFVPGSCAAMRVAVEALVAQTHTLDQLARMAGDYGCENLQMEIESGIPEVHSAIAAMARALGATTGEGEKP